MVKANQNANFDDVGNLPIWFQDLVVYVFENLDMEIQKNVTDLGD